MYIWYTWESTIAMGLHLPSSQKLKNIVMAEYIWGENVVLVIKTSSNCSGSSRFSSLLEFDCSIWHWFFPQYVWSTVCSTCTWWHTQAVWWWQQQSEKHMKFMLTDVFKWISEATLKPWLIQTVQHRTQWTNVQSNEQQQDMSGQVLYSHCFIFSH